MSTTEQQRLNIELASRSFDYGKEFRLKVSVDYGAYVFLAPKREEVVIDEIVDYAKRNFGLDAYRQIYKKGSIIHIYMKFAYAEMARQAIEGIKGQYAPLLHVASVQDMLEAMYAMENTERTYPLWTVTIVDAVGELPPNYVLHKEDFVEALCRCGDTKIFDSLWDGGKVRCAQALFSSMAEALGAAIVHGDWVSQRNQWKNFYYRVRIVGGEKEFSIFSQLWIPNVKEVFDMEYFVGGEATCYVAAQPQVYLNQPEIVYQPQNEFIPTQQCSELHFISAPNYPMNPPAQAQNYPMNPPVQPQSNFPTNLPAQPQSNFPTNLPAQPQNNYPMNPPVQPQSNFPTNPPDQPQYNYPINHPAQPQNNYPMNPPAQREPRSNFPTNAPTQPQRQRVRRQLPRRQIQRQTRDHAQIQQQQAMPRT